MTQQTILLIAGIGLLLFGAVQYVPRIWGWIAGLFTPRPPVPPTPAVKTRQAYVAAFGVLEPILTPELAASVWGAIGAVKEGKP